MNAIRIILAIVGLLATAGLSIVVFFYGVGSDYSPSHHDVFYFPGIALLGLITYLIAEGIHD